MSEKDKKLNFSVCPECSGAGMIDKQPCQKCHGLGTAARLQDKVIYWGKYFDSKHLAYEAVTRKLIMAYNIILALIGLSGLFLMGYIGYLDNFSLFFQLEYWLTPDWVKFYFWLTLLVDLYLYYRLDQVGASGGHVLTKVFKSEQIPPSWHSADLNLVEKKDQLDIAKSFIQPADEFVQAAWRLAKHFDHNQVQRIHLLGVLPQFDKSAVILGRLGINFESFKKKISRYLNKNIISRPGNPVLSVEAQKTLLQAYREAYLSNKDKVDIPEIILALAEPSDCRVTEERDDVEEILVDYDLNYQKMKNVVAWIRIQEELRSNLQRYRGRAKYKPKSGLDRAMTAVATPFLDKFSDDLTLQAKYGHFFPCIGREEEFEKIFRITQGSRQGVMLIGHQGVGRTTIIQGLAQRMVSEDVPEELQDKRLVNLKVSSLLAGVDAAGAEQRLLVIADEVIRSGNIILVVEDIHNLHGITAGGQSSLDLSEVFAEVMGKHLFLTIATTYPQEYSQAIEGRSLDAVFQNIKVDELEINQAIQVLEAKSGPIEYQNSLYFSYDAIEQAALLSARYIHDRYLPDKAIEILEQVAVKVKKTRGEKSLIKGEDVAEVISEMTGIPLTKVTEKESEKLLNLEDRIHERMVDQEEAVKAVASGIRRARAELREGKRPISSMLFLGPTGVGKTELAKTVSEVYFGSEESMIRLDMSEYQNQASLVRLIGHGREAGYLTEKVRKNPFALLLFDEVEKAHPDILNIFLQVLDDGRLTDAQGRTIDFTNTIIIMTSNAGAQYIQDEINKGTEVDKIKDYLINEKLKQHFRPEFLNRFDGVVVFKPLSMVDVIKIAKLMVNKISRRLEEKGIEFSATEAAIAELAESGFDPKFGARPLRRTIQTKVDDVLADYLLKGEISRRDKVVLEVGGKLNIEKAKKL